MPYRDKNAEREYKRKQMARRRKEDPERFKETLRRSYAKHRERRLADNKAWRHGLPERNRASYLVSGAKKRAAAKGIEFDLTFEWAIEKINAGVCEVTGLPFSLSPPGGHAERSPWSPSVDKIDPSKGYTRDNCRVVVWIYNAAKSEFSDSDVLRMAMSVVTGPLAAVLKK